MVKKKWTNKKSLKFISFTLILLIIILSVFFVLNSNEESLDSIPKENKSDITLLVSEELTSTNKGELKILNTYPVLDSSPINRNVTDFSIYFSYDIEDINNLKLSIIDKNDNYVLDSNFRFIGNALILSSGLNVLDNDTEYNVTVDLSSIKFKDTKERLNEEFHLNFKTENIKN